MCKYQNLDPINDYMSLMKLDKSENTIYDYSKKIERFFDFLGVTTFDDVSNINLQDCRKYMTHLSGEGLMKSSINSYIRPLKALFDWLVGSEYLDRSPFFRIKYLREPVREVAYLSLQEAQKTLKACNRFEDKLIISMLLTTGLRRSEITGLKLLDYDGSHLRIIGKGDKERVMPLLPEVRVMMDKYIKIRNKRHGDKYPWLFVSKGGSFGKESENNGQFSGESIRRKVKNAMEMAGIPEKRLDSLSTHSLRHTFTANLFQSNTDIRTAQVALGHSNIQTTTRYAHLSKSAFDKAVLNQKSILQQEALF